MDRDPRAIRTPAVSPTAGGLLAQGLPDPTVGQTAAAFSRAEWGIPIRPEISRPTASTTAGDALVGDPRRIAWLIVNRGTTDVSLDIDAQAVAGQGVLLAAGGGWASMDVREDGEAVAYRVSVIAAAGTPQLWIYAVHAV